MHDTDRTLLHFNLTIRKASNLGKKVFDEDSYYNQSDYDNKYSFAYKGKFYF